MANRGCHSHAPNKRIEDNFQKAPIFIPTAAVFAAAASRSPQGHSWAFCCADCGRQTPRPRRLTGDVGVLASSNDRKECSSRYHAGIAPPKAGLFSPLWLFLCGWLVRATTADEVDRRPARKFLTFTSNRSALRQHAKRKMKRNLCCSEFAMDDIIHIAISFFPA